MSSYKLIKRWLIDVYLIDIIYVCFVVSDICDFFPWKNAIHFPKAKKYNYVIQLLIGIVSKSVKANIFYKRKIILFCYF